MIKSISPMLFWYGTLSPLGSACPPYNTYLPASPTEIGTEGADLVHEGDLANLETFVKE